MGGVTEQRDDGGRDGAEGWWIRIYAFCGLSGLRSFDADVRSPLSPPWRRCFFIDAPSIFGLLWAALSPFIDPVTKKKIVFIKSADFKKKMDLATTGKAFGGLRV